MIVEEVRLWKLTRRHVRERLEQGLIKGAILPTGSTEQHNEHLAMEHDTASAAHVAHQAALQLYPQTVVAPPLAVGISEHWMEFPGTLSLRPETFFSVAYDICESLKRHGIEHILICIIPPYMQKRRHHAQYWFYRLWRHRPSPRHRLARIRSARIIAATDVVAAAASGFARDFRAEHHGIDYRQMLDLPDLDAVWVCTPTFQPCPGRRRGTRRQTRLLRETHGAQDGRRPTHGSRLRRGRRPADHRLCAPLRRPVGQTQTDVQSGALGRPVIWRFAAGGRPARPWFRDVGKGREKVYTYPHRDMFVEQDRHVVKCFSRGEQPLVTGGDGIAALAVATSVLKAGRDQRTVKI